jgi:hypothetical protein
VRSNAFHLVDRFPVTTWYAVRTSPEPGSRDEDGTITCLN